LQNIKLQEEYQARNDSMARVTADTPVTSNPSSIGDSTTERVPVALDRDSGSTHALTQAPLNGDVAVDSVKYNVGEVLKDTLKEKMIKSLSHNRAAASAEAPTTELVLAPEQSVRLDSIINEREFQSRAASIALNTARTLKNSFSNNFTRLDGFE